MINSSQIKESLSARHSKDFFITECKSGPSTLTNTMRFDAYAISKSWMNLTFYGYEVKVSRSDFLADKKWMGYLSLCNQFSFVCPKDMIKPEEIPENVGLIYYYLDSGSLRTVKKAVHRQIETPIDLLLYCIISRIKSDRYPFFSNKQDYFKGWIENKKLDYDLGRNVSKAFNEKIKEFDAISERNKELVRENYEYQAVKEVLKKHNIKRHWGDTAKDLNEALSNGFTPEIKQGLNNIIDGSNKILKYLEKTNEEKQS